MLRSLKRLLLTPLVWLAVLVFLLEEYIWDSTARVMARLGAYRAVHAIENHISSLSSRWAVFAFLLPSCILVPAKLIGLHAIANGHWLFGGTVFVLAKIAGMALFSRIFNLTRPALMQVHWFAKLYEFIMRYRNKIHTYLDNWAAYQQTKRKLTTLRYMLKGKGRLLRFLRRLRKHRQA